MSRLPSIVRVRGSWSVVWLSAESALAVTRELPESDRKLELEELEDDTGGRGRDRFLGVIGAFLFEVPFLPLTISIAELREAVFVEGIAGGFPLEGLPCTAASVYLQDGPCIRGPSLGRSAGTGICGSLTKISLSEEF